MSLRKTFRALVWASPYAQYFPEGRYQDISCIFVVEGNFGINMSGEIIPTATATAVPPDGDTGFSQDTIGIRAGKKYSNVAQFEDSDFKSTVRIKDTVTQNTWYVDKTSFDARSADCNDCCITP